MTPLQQVILAVLAGAAIYHLFLRPKEYPRVLLIDPANPGQVLAELKNGRHMIGSLRTHRGQELTGFILSFASISLNGRFRQFSKAPSGKPWRRAYLVLEDPKHLYEHRGTWGREYVVFGRFEPRMLDSAREIAFIHVPPDIRYEGMIAMFDLAKVMEQWDREAQIAKLEREVKRLKDINAFLTDRLETLELMTRKHYTDVAELKAALRRQLRQAKEELREGGLAGFLRPPKEVREIEEAEKKIERVEQVVKEAEREVSR